MDHSDRLPCGKGRRSFHFPAAFGLRLPEGYTYTYTHNSQTEREVNMSQIPTIDMVKTGENIDRLRKKSGLSVKQLQDLFGFSTPQAIYKWQHGTALPSVDNLVALSSIFQVSVEDILVLEKETEDEVDDCIA